jgi:ribosomal protein S18 acetylase RimI-like enzyme
MENIIIQKVNSSERELLLLQKIGRQTFFETFASKNTAENMKKYLETGFSLETLKAELANSNAEFYFAWRDDQIIGYLKLNFGASQTELQEDKALEIERIYVLQAFQGKKVGQMLYEKALQIAKQAKFSYIWLGVWEENPNAIQFYEKNGFVTFDKHIFKLGEDEQIDLMMKLSL